MLFQADYFERLRHKLRIWEGMIEMTEPLITNIQRFSLHDGPGIRTTVFFKGCSLRCPWCSNPENLVGEKQNYVKDGVKGSFGENYTTTQVYNEVKKDKAFYDGKYYDFQELQSDHQLFDKLPGGVTFTGGECLLQINMIEDLLIKLKKENIHTCVETCLFINVEQLSIAMKYIDLFYVDMKILDQERCKGILNGNLQQYLKNLKILFDHNKPVVIRVPVIGGYTDQAQNRKSVAELLQEYKDKIIKVELIKEHNLGISKYQSLINGGNSIKLPEYFGVTDDMMEMYKNEIVLGTGLWTEICKI